MLRGIAFEALRKINGDNISDKSIRDAVFEAESNTDMGGGVFRASEEVFSLMLAGRSVSELVDGCRVSPLMKRDKSSERKFGGIIDAYTISEAEVDGVVLSP